MKQILKEGDELELATAAYFQWQGYLVRRGVKLSAVAGEKDVTDADLLAIRFQLPVREERVVVDCRDRSKPRPFERVLWTLGIAAFTKAHRPIVVTRKPITAAREFAAQGGVEILAAEDLPRLIGKGTQPYGDADPGVAARLNRAAGAKTPQTKDLFRELLRVRQMLVVGNPLTNLNRLISTIRRLRSERAGGGDVEWLRKFVCDDAAVMATLMLLRFVEESKWTPAPEWRTNLTKRLTYGDMPPKKALQLARIALDQTFHDGLPPPEYTEEVAGLVNHMISNPALAVWTAVAVDYLLFADDGKSGTAARIPAVPDDLQSGVLLLGKRTISAIAFAVGAGAAPDAGANAASAAKAAPASQPSLPIDRVDENSSKDEKDST